MVFLGIL